MGTVALIDGSFFQALIFDSWRFPVPIIWNEQHLDFKLMTMIRKITIVYLLMVAPFIVFCQSDDAGRRRNFNNENFVALREFDPVSYFNGKPQRGSVQFEHQHKGITYYFANAENREVFKKSPSKFEPAYGGWCAYTLATKGQRVKVMPTTYKIVNGKLFLFYNFGGDNRLMKWNGDEKKLKTLADKNWEKTMH
jgi:YHS domain-containing protein